MKIAFSLPVAHQQNFCCGTNDGRPGVDKPAAATSMDCKHGSLPWASIRQYVCWIRSDRSQQCYDYSYLLVELQQRERSLD